MDRHEANRHLKSRLDQLVRDLAPHLEEMGDRYVGTCEAHGGDNPIAMSINIDGEYRSLWTCWSHSCHEYWGRDLYGLIWAILSHKEGWSAPGDIQVDQEVVDQWISNFLNNSIEPQNLNDRVQFQKKKVAKHHPKFSKKVLGELLTIPSPFYSIDYRQGIKVRPKYSEAVLARYWIGDCQRIAPDPLNKLYRRAVVPIFDAEDDAIAFSGRALLSKCPSCNLYHDGICPPKPYPSYVKWRHLHLTSSNTLYNYYENLQFFKDNKICIIVESPGNSLRLEDAGIPGSVATFGAKLSEGQVNLLAKANVETILVLFDSDEAGFKGFNKISNKYGKDFKVIFPPINLPHGRDLGDFPTDVVKRNVRKVISKYGENF